MRCLPAMKASSSGEGWCHYTSDCAARLSRGGFKGVRRFHERRQRDGEEDRDTDDRHRGLDSIEVPDQSVAQRGGDAAQRSQRVEETEGAREAVLLDEFAERGVE